MLARAVTLGACDYKTDSQAKMAKPSVHSRRSAWLKICRGATRQSGGQSVVAQDGELSEARGIGGYQHRQRERGAVIPTVAAGIDQARFGDPRRHGRPLRL